MSERTPLDDQFDALSRYVRTGAPDGADHLGAVERRGVQSRRRRQAASLTATVAAIALTIGVAGALTGGNDNSMVGTDGGTTSTVAPVTSTVPAVTSPPDPCGNDLRITSSVKERSAGVTNVELVFINGGATPCRLSGRPAVHFTAEGAQVSDTAGADPAHLGKDLVLAPNRSATVQLRVEMDEPGSATCGATVSAQLQVSAGNSWPTSIPWDNEVCTGAAAPRMTVSAFNE